MVLRIVQLGVHLNCCVNTKWLICLAQFFVRSWKGRSPSRRLRIGSPERAEGVKARSPEGGRVAAALTPEHAEGR
jgi:hypothetical protein